MPGLTDEQIGQILRENEALKLQRNEALDSVAKLYGQAKLVEDSNNALKTALTELQEKLKECEGSKGQPDTQTQE